MEIIAIFWYIIMSPNDSLYILKFKYRITWSLNWQCFWFKASQKMGNVLHLPSIRLLGPQIELSTPGYKVSDFTTTRLLLPLFPGFPSSGTGWFMVWCYVWQHSKVKLAVVWSKTLRRGGHRLKSHVKGLNTQGSNFAPLCTKRIVYLLHYTDIQLYKLMSW